jgi:hypothetical protein
VLVEGASDRAAVLALAERRGRDLAADGVAVVPLGGAQALARFLAGLGPRAAGLRLAGLCDAREEAGFRRALEHAGLERDVALGVCVRDLEDELIRALGAPTVEELLEARGDLRRFRTLQKQPSWRGRPTEEQLRRFFGSGGSRKVVYAPLLVRALGPGCVPRPLELVLERV